ncbi:carbohydrate ABC transporter permease [Thermus oshimai]|uniref:carbohydrate ABC transporter permease n=1 Tax=Thermus oshimai TaxID=56957 RepID=UPI000477E060|nr:sugar ABC transporter permease [Thermus oshimai]
MVRSERRLLRRAAPLREGLWAYGFLLPAYLLFGAFYLWPLLQGVWLSLHEEDFLGRKAFFVGLAQYAQVLQAPEFWAGALRSLFFALMVVPLELGLGLLAALLVYRNYPGVALFRVLFFLTAAVPTAVAAVAWGWFLHPVGGYLNHLLQGLGLGPFPWLTHPAWALPTLAAVTAWSGVGFTAILLTAGLQSIPEEVLEAALVDGATPWVRFLRVTLPLLSPVLFLVGLLVVLKSLTAFGPIHLLTRGGPLESTTVWIYRVYQDAFFNFRVPYALAEAVLLLLLLIALAALQFWLLGRRVHYA